jgi:hypothetical protein
LGERFLYCEGEVPLLFTENETNTECIFGTASRTPYVKDAINNFIVHQQSGGINPGEAGTKVSPHCHVTVNPGQCEVIRLRLNDIAPKDLNATYLAANGDPFGVRFDATVSTRREEADQFYATDARMVTMLLKPFIDIEMVKLIRPKHSRNRLAHSRAAGPQQTSV